MVPWVAKKGSTSQAVSKPSESGWVESGRTECAHDKPLLKMVLWAIIWSPLPVYVRIKPGFETACSVRPLYHSQPKKRPSMVEGSEADGDEMLCAPLAVGLLRRLFVAVDQFR